MPPLPAIATLPYALLRSHQVSASATTVVHHAGARHGPPARSCWRRLSRCSGGTQTGAEADALQAAGGVPQTTPPGKLTTPPQQLASPAPGQLFRARLCQPNLEAPRGAQGRPPDKLTTPPDKVTTTPPGGLPTQPYQLTEPQTSRSRTSSTDRGRGKPRRPPRGQGPGQAPAPREEGGKGGGAEGQDPG